jgi:CP family cyanate transporter-like MFS transporter
MFYVTGLPAANSFSGTDPMSLSNHENRLLRQRALPAPSSPLLLVITLVLISINMRPALSSIAAVLAAIRADTGMSSVTAGLLTTLPVLSFGVFAALAPSLTRRYSSERVIFHSLLILAAGTGLRVYFGIPGLFIGTLVAGATIGVAMVLLPGIIKRDFPRHAGPMTGIYTMALCLGAALAAGITVPIQNLAGGDWRPALAFWLVPALIAAFAWWPQTRRQAPFQQSLVKPAIRGLRSSALAWQVASFMGLQSALAYCVFGWLPTILIDRGMQPLSAGFVLSLSIAMQLITALGGPWLATRGPDQRAAIVMFMSMSLIGLLGCVYAPLDTIWPWAISLGLGMGGSFSVAMTLIVLRASNPQVAASLSGMTQGIGYSLAACGPLVVGVLREFSDDWNTAAVFFVMLTAGATLAGMGAGRNLYVDADLKSKSR